jgi:hypothetical protein
MREGAMLDCHLIDPFVRECECGLCEGERCMRCADCRLCTITAHEWYMVRDELWDRVAGDNFLCVGCLEVRLERELTAEDFTDAPVNDPVKTVMWPRLLDRLPHYAALP